MLCQRIICTNACKLIFCQKASLATKDVQKTNVQPIFESTKEKPKNSYHSNDVYEFLKKKSPKYIDFIPKSMMRRSTRNNSKLYVVDDYYAKSLASMISKDLLSNSSYVMDCNPGLGLLTKELLKIGVPFIHLYELNKSFYEPGSPLAILLKRHPNKLKLHEFNFPIVWKDMHSETSHSQQYCNDMPCVDWKSKPYVQIIEIAPSRRSITLVVYNFFKHTHLFERGRPCFYIGAPSPVWNNLTALNGRYYTQYSVMLHLFFNVKPLGELPREAFIPWPREKYWNLDNLNCPVRIVKLEPKKEVYEILNKDDIESFWHFSKYCLRTSKNKILAEFEKLVPGSGIKLIQQDYGILTTFKELSPQKLLELFKMYHSWPEYDEVLFNFSSSVGYEKKDAEKLEEDEEEVESFEELQQESADCDNHDLSIDDKKENC